MLSEKEAVFVSTPSIRLPLICVTVKPHQNLKSKSKKNLLNKAFLLLLSTSHGMVRHSILLFKLLNNLVPYCLMNLKRHMTVMNRKQF